MLYKIYLLKYTGICLADDISDVIKKEIIIMKRIYQSADQLAGGTPLLQLSNIEKGSFSSKSLRHSKA